MDSNTLRDDLRVRVSTALVLGAAFALLLTLAHFACLGRYLLVLFAALAIGACAFEFSTMCCAAQRADLVKRINYFVVAALPSLCVLVLGLRRGLCSTNLDCGSLLAAATLGFLISALASLALMASASRNGLERAGLALQELFIGLILVGFCGALALMIFVQPASISAVLWLIVVVCANDSAAYFVGRRMQGPKLAPQLSPNKTVSGALGGMLFGTLLGTLLFSLLALDAGSGAAFFFSALVCTASQLGDLGKSYLKRLHGVKDSGALLPGHGGVLDRLDGVLAAAPLVFLWIAYSLGS